MQIAVVFRERYGVTMLAALRMVRDWSQRDAAEQWNRRWPDDLKTYKTISYWEVWPARTGHAPSLSVLSRLAELYECSVSDLVSDRADFRDRDSSSQAIRALDKVRAIARDTPTDTDEMDALDVADFARAADVRASRTGAARRESLLRLAAAVSLAAAEPTALDDTDRVLPQGERYDGIWRSEYVYPSTSREADFVGEHYVTLRHRGTTLRGDSAAHPTGSRLRLELTLESAIATGTWRERTSPTGYYRGATYHGSLHLVVDPTGDRMKGMWLGFSRDFTVTSGAWQLTRVQQSITPVGTTA